MFDVAQCAELHIAIPGVVGGVVGLSVRIPLQERGIKLDLHAG